MQCPRTSGLKIVSRKWSYYLLRALRTPLTFSDIRRELRFVTNHILSRELKQLQAEKLIVLEEGLYRITPAGTALLAAVEPLYKWSMTHQAAQECPAQLQCSHCVHYPEVVLKQSK